MIMAPLMSLFIEKIALFGYNGLSYQIDSKGVKIYKTSVNWFFVMNTPPIC